MNNMFKQCYKLGGGVDIDISDVSAGGTWTRLGGSRPDDDVLTSMQLANDDFCDLNELFIK